MAVCLSVRLGGELATGPGCHPFWGAGRGDP